MRLINAVTKKLIERIILRAMTGKLTDLEKVLALARRMGTTGLRDFLEALARDSSAQSGFAQLFLRLGGSISPLGKRKLVRNLVCNWGLEGPRIRGSLEKRGIHAPSHIVISPSMRCNLRCTGCYSGLYSKDGELSEEEIDRVLTEARGFGSYFIVVSGGEPYLMKDAWMRLWKKHSDMFFMTYTNGTLLDQQTVDELARLGNVAPAISVEGYREETDRRRGAGVFDTLSGSMDRLRKAGVIFGISVTYTRENAEIVSSESFLRHYIDVGAIFGWYFMFMPVGKDPILELVPTPEQRLAFGRRIAAVREHLPIFLADFWNDGPAVGGCLAGGRLYLHILNSGRVEPCVFAHFGVDNVREKSILEAANSPFFQSIRKRFPYNQNGNLMRPCMIIDNPQVLRETVAESMARQGHEGSEDIIRNPKVVEWVDRYAERYRALTDPEWERTIDDPKNKWHRKGKSYQSLFGPMR
ncbi:MAG: radical SAM protein [Spirochaetia bacterium]|jgi:MoaA/NifB/PqqE/SkfB family radical SAM enzyme